MGFSLRLLRLGLLLGAVSAVLWLLPHEIAALAMTLLLLGGSLLGGVRLIRLDWPRVLTTLHEALQPLMPILRLMLGSAGLALIVLAAWMLLPHQPLRVASTALLVTALAGLALALVLYADPVLINPKPSLPAPERPIRWRWALLGISMLLLLLQVHFLLVAPAHALISHHVQIALFVGGLGLMTWGLLGAPRLRLPTLRLTHEGWALLLIVLLALFVRLWELGIGLHRWVDEINFLFGINELSLIPTNAILMPFGGITAFSWLYPYGQWVWRELFGPSLESVRMISVLFGVAQVVALWWLMRPLAGVRVALLSALLIATFPPAIHFSRIGINNIADPVFGTLALGFLARGLQAPRRSAFVLAGVMLGLSHYFYEGGRLFFTLFAACWLGWVALSGRLMVGRVGTWAAGGLAFLMTAGPLYAAWLFNGRTLIPRYEAVGKQFRHLEHMVQMLADPAADITPFLYPFLSYVHLPDTGQFYINDTGFILPVLVPFFLLGLVVCVWRGRTLGGGMLFWWCVGVAVANLILNNEVDAPRYVVVFPALCAVTALGMHQLWSWAEAALPRLPWRPVAVALLVALSAGQVHYYLGYHLPAYYMRHFYDEIDYFRRVPVKDADDMIFRAVRLRPPVEVYVFSPGFANVFAFGATLPYFGLHQQDHFYFRHNYTENLESTLAQYPPTEWPKAFFIEPEDAESLALLRERFTLYGPYFSPFRAPIERQFALYVTDPAVMPPEWLAQG
ncbi:glycosyltransferase family 39 protein [Aggregatilineales bacterium SYSU G02658]